MHHCIQGWSGIAKWGGIPMQKLIELVQPNPKRRSSRFSPLAKLSMADPITTPKVWRTCESPNVCWLRG